MRSLGLAEASRGEALWAARECACGCLAQDVGERRGHGVDVRDTSGEGGVRELGDNILRYSRPPALIRRQEFPVEGYAVVPLLPVSGGGWVRSVLGGGWKLKPGGGLISSSGGQ